MSAPRSFSKPVTRCVARSWRSPVDDGRGEVEEVVRLDELLVAGALRVEAAGDAQPARPAERRRGREAGRQDRVAVDGAPVEPQARLHRQPRRDRVAVLEPGAAAGAAERRVEAVGESRSAAHARRVGGGFVAVAGDGEAGAGCEPVQLDPGVEGVGGREGERQLLAQRQVAHRQVAVEDDAGQPFGDRVVGRVRPPRRRFERRVDAEHVGVAVPRDDRARRGGAAEQRVEA